MTFIRHFAKTLGALVLSVGVGGCATVEPRPDYQRTQEHIQDATDQAEAYRPDDEDAIAVRVDELLADGITIDEAVQISLLNNPRLRAAFFELGIARADVVQAGLFSNPSLGVSVRLPSSGGLANIDAGLAQNIAELWQLPLRKLAAEEALQQTILSLAQQASTVAAETKAAYYAAIGAHELHRTAEEDLSVGREVLRLAEARREVGASDVLDVNLSRGLVLEAELNLVSADLAESEARRTLAGLLGVNIPASELNLLDALPTSAPILSDVDRLIELAGEHRLDLRSSARAVAAAAARYEQERRSVFRSVEVGVSIERNERRRQGGRDVLADTARASIASGALTAPEIQPRSERGSSMEFIVGPSLSLELPIFDQNQAQIAKAHYAHRQAIKLHDALRSEVIREVRGAADRSATAWRLVDIYREHSIPLASENLDLARESYQAGKATFLTVLEAQRFFLNARKRHIEAQAAAARTVPALEQLISLPLAQWADDGPAADDVSGAEDTGGVSHEH